MDEVVLGLEVLNNNRFGGLERAARRGPQIGGQRGRPDDALLPPKTRGDQ